MWQQSSTFLILLSPYTTLMWQAWKATFGDRVGAGHVRIPRTEERGITVSQLRAVLDEVNARWAGWGVVDFHSQGEAPESVSGINLYAVNEHLIKAKTKPFRCSYVELVAQVRPLTFSCFMSHLRRV